MIKFVCNSKKENKNLCHYTSAIRRKLVVPQCEFYAEEILAEKSIQKAFKKTKKQTRTNSLHELDLQLNRIIYSTGWSFGLGCTFILT